MLHPGCKIPIRLKPSSRVSMLANRLRNRLSGLCSEVSLETGLNLAWTFQTQFSHRKWLFKLLKNCFSYENNKNSNQIFVKQNMFTVWTFEGDLFSLAPGVLIKVCFGGQRKRPLYAALDFQSTNWEHISVVRFVSASFFVLMRNPQNVYQCD